MGQMARSHSHRTSAVVACRSGQVGPQAEHVRRAVIERKLTCLPALRIMVPRG